MGEMRKAYKILVGTIEGRDNLRDLGVHGKIKKSESKRDAMFSYGLDYPASG
jgi:hypothetical protein